MWQNYRQVFPTRYLQLGTFDHAITNLIQELQPKTILDLGGGEGTTVLKNLTIPVDLLDPFIIKPDWMRQQVDWQTQLKYDLVVARGCINYLSLEELQKIPQLIQKVFIANTFKNPPSRTWSERPFTNQKGEKGLERFRLKDRLVEHQLVFDSQIIEHTFYYRSLLDWEDALGEVQILEYGSNSLILFKEIL